MGLLKRHHLILLGACALALAMLSGCRSSSATYHISEDVDFSFIKKVAVMPFDNLSGNRTAGEVVRHLVISELLASGLVDVVVPGEVMAAISDLDIKNITSPNEKEIKALGRALNAEGVLLGVVEQYGEARMGNVSAPEVTVTLMLADSSSGNIIWSITKTRGGSSFMARHFGAKAETMSETVLALVRDALQTLAQY